MESGLSIWEWQKNSNSLSKVRLISLSLLFLGYKLHSFGLSGWQPSSYSKIRKKVKKRAKGTFHLPLWEGFWKLPKYTFVFSLSTDFNHMNTQLRYKELSFKEIGKLFWVAICTCKHFIIMELGLTSLISQRREFSSLPWYFPESK